MNRFSRIVLAVAFVLLGPLSASGQSRPQDQDLPRLNLLLDALSRVPPADAQAAIKQLSPRDVDGLLWVINNRSTARGYQSYSEPDATPPATYTQPRARQQQTTVITTNPYLGTPISPYDPRVNQYSPQGANNPYATQGGKIYGQDGTYLGKLNANKYDPESVANPYGKYGSPYSSTSINNPYSQYGSPYSAKSAKNPYTTTPPLVIYGDTAKKY
jgi:hypothetical protein